MFLHSYAPQSRFRLGPYRIEVTTPGLERAGLGARPKLSVLGVAHDRAKRAIGDRRAISRKSYAFTQLEFRPFKACFSDDRRVSTRQSAAVSALFLTSFKGKSNCSDSYELE